jgi:hypothetical protein
MPAYVPIRPITATYSGSLGTSASSTLLPRKKDIIMPTAVTPNPIDVHAQIRHLLSTMDTINPAWYCIKGRVYKEAADFALEIDTEYQYRYHKRFDQFAIIQEIFDYRHFLDPENATDRKTLHEVEHYSVNDEIGRTAVRLHVRRITLERFYRRCMTVVIYSPSGIDTSRRSQSFADSYLSATGPNGILKGMEPVIVFGGLRHNTWFYDPTLKNAEACNEVGISIKNRLGYNLKDLSSLIDRNWTICIQNTSNHR